MQVKIIEEPLTLMLHGFSGTASNGDHAATAFRLMDKMWKVVKSANLENKGINIWVYEEGNIVFAGVELTGQPGSHTTLEPKTVTLRKHARYKHIGPYHLIKEAGKNMKNVLVQMGYRPAMPYIEIYGHWNNDESKLETDLVMAIQ